MTQSGHLRFESNYDIPSSNQNPVSEAPERNGKLSWAGAVWSALPMVICLVVANVLVSGASKVTIVFALIACLVVWIPLAISRIALRLMSWSSPKAHLSAMFAFTFIPMLGVYKFYEFDPDASLCYQINEGGKQFIEFSVAGVVVALIAGLINLLCMWVFLHVTHRQLEGASATQ